MHIALLATKADPRPPVQTHVPSLRDFAAQHATHERRLRKDGPLWAPIELRAGASRKKENVLTIWAYVVDLDELTRERAEETLALLLDLGLAAWVYSTWSYTDDKPKLRIAMPLSRPALAAEWPRFWASMQTIFTGIDSATRDASRIYYLPSAPSTIDDSQIINTWIEGEPIDVDLVMAEPLPGTEAPVIAEGPSDVVITSEVRSWCARQVDLWARRIRALPYPGPIYPTLNPAGFALGRYVPHVLSIDEVRTTIDSALTARAPITRDKNLSIFDRALIDGSKSPWYPTPWGPLSDVALAERLARDHGERIRYVVDWQRWIEWIDGRWTIHGADARTYGAVGAMTTALRTEAEYTSESRAKALREAARRLDTAAGVSALVRVARARPELHVWSRDLDRDPWAFACPNGIVDLRNGALSEPTPDAMITHLSSVRYDPTARAPLWERFVLEICGGDIEYAQYLQRAVGYSLTGSTREQCLFFLYGDGANGKSTFFETLKSILGEHATTAPSNLLLQKNGEQHPTTIAALHGRRFVSTSEVDEGRAWDEPIVKSLTGSDEITARRMREDFWTFRPTHTLWIAGNYRPTVRGNDAGIWRRIRLLPFEANFRGREDRTLLERLREEAAGILAWAVRGAEVWLRHGLGEPHIVVEATAAYREESDPIADWLGELWVVTGNATDRVSRAQLYTSYQSWAERHGATRYGARGLAERLRRHVKIGEAIYAGARLWTGLIPKSATRESSLN